MGEENNGGEGGEQTPSWRDAVPEFARDWKEVKDSDSADKFYQTVDHARKYMGNSVRIPGEDASTEAMDEFYTKIQAKVPGLQRALDVTDEATVESLYTQLGRPKDASGYGEVEGMSGERLGELRGFAHDIGMTKTQFDKYAAQSHAMDETRRTDSEAAAQSHKDALMAEWGAATDIRREQAAVLAEKTGAPKSLVEAVEAGVADLETMKWLHGLGKQLGMEASALTRQSDVMAPAEVDGKIDDIMNNAEHPYWNSSHPSHDKAVKNMLDLMRKRA